MTMPIAGGYDAVPPQTYRRLPTVSSAVCRCGSVYDNGNVVVPAAYAELCGRCAFDRGCGRATARTSDRHADCQAALLELP